MSPQTWGSVVSCTTEKERRVRSESDLPISRAVVGTSQFHFCSMVREGEQDSGLKSEFTENVEAGRIIGV